MGNLHLLHGQPWISWSPLCSRLQSSAEAGFRVCACKPPLSLPPYACLFRSAWEDNSGSKGRAGRVWISPPGCWGPENECHAARLSMSLHVSEQTNTPIKPGKSSIQHFMTQLLGLGSFLQQGSWNDGLMRTEWTKEINEPDCLRRACSSEAFFHWQLSLCACKPTHGPSRAKWQNSFSKEHKFLKVQIKI